MTGRTLVALLTDSTFLYFLQPIISDGLIGTVFPRDLATSRPMAARLAGDFYPMDDELHLRPRIRRLFWALTLGWAAALPRQGDRDPVAAAVPAARDLRASSAPSVLLLNGAAVATTIAAATFVARRELLGGLPEQVLPEAAA